MTDFERALRSLEIDWPQTPELSLELARRRRARMVVATAVVAAVAVAFAVPQSRSAILDLFSPGGRSASGCRRARRAGGRPGRGEGAWPRLPSEGAWHLVRARGVRVDRV